MLKQGVKFVNDYTGEFYQLMARNELKEMEERLVVRDLSKL